MAFPKNVEHVYIAGTKIVGPVDTKNAKVVRMCNKSLVFDIDGNHYFATKRVANAILTNQVSEVFIVQQHSDNGCMIEWLGIVSIF